MNLRSAILVILLLTSLAGFAQHAKEFRDSMEVNLPVDGEKFYQQKIERSPYFVKEKVLQIYPGESLYIEVLRSKKNIDSMRVVTSNLNPDRTIVVELRQSVEERKHQSTVLEVTNPFREKLKYKAIMYIVGHNKWIETSIMPVQGKLIGYEMWPDVIISLVLHSWELE